MWLHALLHAGSAQVEPGGIWIVDRVGVVAFHPLAAGRVTCSAQGAHGRGAAISDDQLIRELGMFAGFAAAPGGDDFVGEVVAFEPVVEDVDFVGVAEADPGAESLVEEEAFVFKSFLNEGVWPGGKFDGFSRGHAGMDIPWIGGECNDSRVLTAVSMTWT